MVSRYTLESEKRRENKKQKVDERLYYKFEDDVFSKHAELSFSFKTVFRETLEDGSKRNIIGGVGGSETHYKLVYLIKFSEYEKRLKEL